MTLARSNVRSTSSTDAFRWATYVKYINSYSSHTIVVKKGKGKPL